MHMPIDFVFGLLPLQKQNLREDREEKKEKWRKRK